MHRTDFGESPALLSRRKTGCDWPTATTNNKLPAANLCWHHVHEHSGDMGQSEWTFASELPPVSSVRFSRDPPRESKLRLAPCRPGVPEKGATDS